MIPPAATSNCLLG